MLEAKSVLTSSIGADFYHIMAVPVVMQGV